MHRDTWRVVAVARRRRMARLAVAIWTVCWARSERSVGGSGVGGYFDLVTGLVVLGGFDDRDGEVGLVW